jgi:hypothetical protein
MLRGPAFFSCAKLPRRSACCYPGLNQAGPVAVLTTPDFDAATIDTSDLSRIRFGDVNGGPGFRPCA